MTVRLPHFSSGLNAPRIRLDSPAASRLGTNRALLYRDERGTLEKFRPYGPPSDDWLKRLINLRHPSAADEPDRPEDLDINEWIIV